MLNVMNDLRKTKFRLVSILSSLAAFQRKHWVITLFFINLSAIWLPFIYTFLGVPLKLVSVVEGTCQFTSFGFWILIAYLVVIGIGNGSTIYDERTNGNRKEIDELKSELLEQTESGIVLRELNSSANNICESKLSTLIDTLDYFLNNSNKIPPRIISDPHRQLNKLSKELSSCLAELLKFQDRRYVTDLFTSIIYRLPQENCDEWQWATSERGLSIAELIDPGKRTTFQYLLEDKGHSLFFNSKQQAADKGKYVSDKEDIYDENGKLKGSIACYRFGVQKNNKTIIEMVISVTSYDQQFVQGVDNGDEIVQNVRHNIDRVVLPNFLVRAKIELCLLYLKHLHDTRTIP